MKGTWNEPEPLEVPTSFRELVGGHPLVAEILARRGVTTPDAARAFLDPGHYVPTAPAHLPGVEAAIERLGRAARAGETVVIWGDFDVDGQTATAILMTAFTQLGMRASYYIPHRGEESHGLNKAALDEVLREGASLLVTCDCGVSDTAELEYCRQRGIEVIVTDHHDLPADPVPAPIVIDPKMLPADDPIYNLCGAGVAYMLAAGLLASFGRGRLAEDLLDLVSLGTVADVVPLLAENRYLVQRGLPVLADGRRVGMAALMRMINVTVTPYDADSVAYDLSPALNAAGRLSNAELAVRLLLTRDQREAEDLSAQVVALNEERRYQTRMVERMALDLLEKMPRPLPAALILSHREWHPGITGIVAGRLTEQFHRPAILISLPEVGVARGSARSVAGVDVHQAIAQQRDLLVAEGGHPMAAGFGIMPENLDEFSARLLQAVIRQQPAESMGRAIRVDAWVNWGDVSLELCDELGRLAPFGEANRPPVLAARDLTLTGVQAVGERGDDWRLKLKDAEGVEHDVMWWGGDRAMIPRGNLDVAFTLRSNIYNGARRLQLKLMDVRRTPAPAVDTVVGSSPIELSDERQSGDLILALRQWLDKTGDGVACWGEGKAAREYPGLRRRDQIGPARTLVIWSVPPGPDELRRALEHAQAQRIVLLFGDRPEPDVRTFALDLLGLVRFTLARRSGQADLDTLAGVLATRRSAIVAGLRLLRDLNLCSFDLAGADGVVLGEGTVQAPAMPLQDAPMAAEVRRILDEIAAYRRYVLRADAVRTLPAGYAAAP